MIWAYQYTHQTEHRLYGLFKIGTTVLYSGHYVLRNGDDGGFQVKSQAEAQKVLEYLNTTQPHMIIGYSDQLSALAQNNHPELVRLSIQKEKESQNIQNQESDEETSPYWNTWTDDMPSLKYPRD